MKILGIGAIVYLRSGSPRMTVTRLYEKTEETTGVVVRMAEVSMMVYGTQEVVRECFPVEALSIRNSPETEGDDYVVPWKREPDKDDTK